MFTYFIQTSSWRLDCRGPELTGRFVKRLWQEFWQDVATMSSSEKWSETGFILNFELIEFPEGLDIKCEEDTFF